MSGRLIVSVSGIKNDTYEHAAEFARELEGRGVPLSLLVAPRLKDKYRLAADVPTQEWLRTRRDGGDAIVLHGYDQAATKRRRSEFSALPRHEARLRLMAADRVMEQTGLRTRVFAAPRWIASPGAIEALPDAGFRMIASLNGIHDLDRDGTIRARVWGIGEGFKAEPWWFKALVLGAGRTARRGGVVRLAISAKQLGRPAPRQAILDAIDLSLHHNAAAGIYEWIPRTKTRVA
ncbi:DUF2334 domain-containing protein [Rhodococcus sp. 05-2256-B2]|uniref:DUF2334 domain-containing protein n=1 Tax=unclassified Rhodococcus (in: high G+C Gram-positive bacteria) TaxID=192944 RepID=UPI000B9C578F|nr:MULTISPECIES: DUF2334 domain-containing protein [unclassified Rhodococcus (in: high G+C Gram-positive bacteria)]OZD87486.1 DUF2334 domain-containing protein [Rhodococcus sp. 05-2256-B3]OZD93707.1 DUF2334 domain-containing protein [Rhodococcus sp. 05-2256-B4]OZE02047.1 DUF2334 domain-containing protein [Rhodococcus sp. 05-2256-B2]OZE08020.1 DUF2334 domain-containing protein [Rhodococcus sp. 05-2256-B1]